VPLLTHVLSMAEAGFVTGASARNWASYGDDVRLAPRLPVVAKALLCDPQTSGGLLVACEPGAVDDVVATFQRHGCDQAARIGRMVAGSPVIEVEI
jgi:selenide,water dikinase